MRTPVRVSVPESFIPPASPFRRGEAGPQPALSLSFLTTRAQCPQVGRAGLHHVGIMLRTAGGILGLHSERLPYHQAWFEPSAYVPNPPASHNALPAAFALSPGNSCTTTCSIEAKSQDSGLGGSLSLGAIRHSEFVARRRRPLLRI